MNSADNKNKEAGDMNEIPTDVKKDEEKNMHPETAGMENHHCDFSWLSQRRHFPNSNDSSNMNPADSKNEEGGDMDEIPTDVKEDEEKNMHPKTPVSSAGMKTYHSEISWLSQRRHFPNSNDSSNMNPADNKNEEGGDMDEIPTDVKEDEEKNMHPKTPFPSAGMETYHSDIFWLSQKRHFPNRNDSNNIFWNDRPQDQADCEDLADWKDPCDFKIKNMTAIN